jgi:hypothetical protein
MLKRNLTLGTMQKYFLPLYFVFSVSAHSVEMPERILFYENMQMLSPKTTATVRLIEDLHRTKCSNELSVDDLIVLSNRPEFLTMVSLPSHYQTHYGQTALKKLPCTKFGIASQ